MTQPKYVATTLKTMLESDLVMSILDRSVNIYPIMHEAISWWDYDLFARKPSPAYTEYGVFKGTDLDLACFMYALAGRGAVINIPTYKAQTQTKVREDQQLKSKYNRNGELIGVVSNKQFFSFSIKVMDQNVIGEDKVGDFRSFSLTGKDGAWYDGWQTIQFEPTLKENRFITENKLWSGNRIMFKNFIHPNRWTSFFGHHYAITKMLIDRLEEESKFLNSEMKRLQAAGISFPDDGSDRPQSHDYSYGDTVSKTFVAFESMIYVPDSNITGEYKPLEEKSGALHDAYVKRKSYTTTIAKLRFMTRASEYAHYMNQDRMPAWLKNVKWEDDFTIPGKRIKWQRLKLFQPKVGEHSVSILKRTFTKKARVAA